jgi:hypothetical protein
MDLGAVVGWARDLASAVESGDGPVDAGERAPRLR